MAWNFVFSALYDPHGRLERLLSSRLRPSGYFSLKPKNPILSHYIYESTLRVFFGFTIKMYEFTFLDDS